MRVLDFTQIDRDQYTSSIGFYQESYEDVPKDWQIDLELYRDFDWQVRPVRIKALEDHSSAPKGLKPVMHAEAENECWQVSLNCYNEVGFDALLFGWNQTEDAFAVDFDSRTRWLSAEIQYTGEENLTDRNLGIWVGSGEALKKREEEKIFPPNGNSTGSSSDGSGWAAMRIGREWDGIFDCTFGNGPELWKTEEEFSYVICIYLDMELEAKFECRAGGKT